MALQLTFSWNGFVPYLEHAALWKGAIDDETHTSLAEELSSSSYRYYIYDDHNMTRTDIREKVKQGNGWTWKFRWGTRFKEYSMWEIRYLEALEKHPFRSYNASEADFILIPIPFGSLLTMASNIDTQLALDALYSEPLFRSNPDKHVAFTFIECIFEHEKVGIFQSYSGLTWAYYEKLKNITLVKDFDTHSWYRLKQTKSQLDKGGWNAGPPFPPMTQHGWSFSLAGAASDPEHALAELSVEKFQNKTFHYFYHTTLAKSANNSTQFRHAPVQSDVVASLVQPSSVGYDIPFEQWTREFSDSKFCLTIRGDKPYSHSLWRSIKNGCIPVVVSDVLPYFSPIFRSQLHMSDYAIIVNESDLLADPAGTLNNATMNLPMEELVRLIKGVNLVQRLIVPNHPASLFVEAFCRETVASQSKEYYSFSDPVYTTT